MNLSAINFKDKFSLFDELWTPKCIAKLDNYIVKIAKIKDDFSWHKHADCDEIFIVNKGSMRIDFREGSAVLQEGELYVVEKGKEHKPHADEVCEIIMLEREDVSNTGDKVNEFTVNDLDWL